MIDLLAAAITRKETITLVYEPGVREIEPHALGWSSDGNPLLRAFQTGGASASGEHIHWKLFRVDRIRSCSGNGGCFAAPRDGYKKGDSAMKNGIIAEL